MGRELPSNLGYLVFPAITAIPTAASLVSASPTAWP